VSSQMVWAASASRVICAILKPTSQAGR
jgi:hypothetical protein